MTFWAAISSVVATADSASTSGGSATFCAVAWALTAWTAGLAAFAAMALAIVGPPGFTACALAMVGAAGFMAWAFAMVGPPFGIGTGMLETVVPSIVTGPVGVTGMPGGG